MKEVVLAALTVWTHGDGLLSVLAPIGLAAVAGTSLLVDLDPAGPSFGSATSLAELVREGPRRDELRPVGAGTAVLANGGIEPGDAEPVVQALLKGWPFVVFRTPVAAARFAPLVPVYPMLPGLLAESPGRFCVYQRSGFAVEQPGAGIVVPRPASATVRRLLGGSLPARSRWLRAWQRVWEHPWR
ncbi:MAG: hypothetical protein OEX97_08960 [Acidimicrobiia bacterium]|nr:hypothetical protein [Acidimicrobiia bacterium]